MHGWSAQNQSTDRPDSLEAAIEDGQSICSQYTISHGSAAKGLRVHMGKQASLHKVMAYV